MNIAGNPDVVDIMFHAPDYRVDVGTLEIVRRAPDSATEAAGDRSSELAGSGSGDHPSWLLVVIGVAFAGSVGMAGAIWRSRQSNKPGGTSER